jgi:hypothetical protein
MQMNKIIKITVLTLFAVCLVNCTNKKNDFQPNDNAEIILPMQIEDTLIDVTQTAIEQEKISILVLPPRDEIANLGISPHIKGYLETALTMDSILLLAKFPKELMSFGVYCGVFDKKYCKQVIEKVEIDFIIMSNLTVNGSKTGNMNTDKWNARIRIYNVKANKQIDSELKISNLNWNEMENFIIENRHILISEIERNQ